MKPLKLYLCLLMLFAICYSNAQSTSEIISKFKDFSLNTGPVTVKARLFVPEHYDPKKKYPVVLTLHGIGERGSDNNNPINASAIATTWADTAFQSKNPCFVLSPQCPAERYFAEYDVYLRVMVLLDSVIRLYSIDTERQYITGLSMGGYGTWYYLQYAPNRFAAAIPICGAYSENNLDVYTNSIAIYRHVPVWTFHGKRDGMAPVAYTRTLIKGYMNNDRYPVLTHDYYRGIYRINDNVLNTHIDNNADLLYSEIWSVGHDVWIQAYRMPLVKKWLFKQRRRSNNAITIEAQQSVINVYGNHTFKFTTTSRTKSISVWYGNQYSASWTFVNKLPANTSNYSFNSSQQSDACFAKLKFLAHDSAGNVIGKAYSGLFNINNEKNAAPFAIFQNDYFAENDSIASNSHTLELLLADAEGSPLDVTYSISKDNGKTFEKYAEKKGVAAGLCTQQINLNTLVRTDSMLVRVEVSDKELTTAIQTLFFKNKNGVTAIPVQASSNDCKVFPNPTTGKVTLSFGLSALQNAMVEVFSTDGRKVFSKSFKNTSSATIDLSGYPKGVYVFKIYRGDTILGILQIIKN